MTTDDQETQGVTLGLDANVKCFGSPYSRMRPRKFASTRILALHPNVPDTFLLLSGRKISPMKARSSASKISG